MIPLMMMAAGKTLQGVMQYQSLMEQADNMSQSAASDLMQIQEIKYRADQNKKSFAKEAQKLMAEQQGAYAGSGVAVSEGAPLDVMTDTVGTMVDRLNFMERETAYTTMIKEQEAASKFKQARKTVKGAPLAVFSGMLGGAGAVAGAS